MRIRCWLASLAVVCVGGLDCRASSAQSAADFYRGKQLRLVIHVNPGGGYDTYGRLMGRYIVNHLPGRPTLVAQNMPGGGGLRAVNHVGAVAPQDGTVLTLVSQGLALYQLTEGFGGKSQLEADLANFNWIGNLSDSNTLAVTWHTSPVKSFADAKESVAVIGASGLGSVSVQMPALVNALSRTRFKIVYGYPGSAEMNVAMERGEIDGRFANSWASYKATQPHWISDRQLNYLVQIGLKIEPELPDVPLLTDLAATDADRQVYLLVSQVSAFGRPVATTPNVPSDRVAALRAAFDATMRDDGFLADAARQQMDVSSMSGAEVEALVTTMARTPRTVIDRLVQAMDPKGAVDVTAGKPAH